MARGTWDPSDLPIIPGFYNRMKLKAKEALMSSQGVLAMPVRSNWGEAETVAEITSIRQLKSLYGDDMNFSAYKLGKIALLGGPQKLLVYRVIDSNAAKGSLILKNSSDSDAIKLTTLYESARNFKVTVSENLIESAKIDVTLYEGTKQLATIEGIENTIDSVVMAINDSDFIEYCIAEKISDATGTLAKIVTAAFTGGNNGVSECTAENYLKAMKAFESYDIDGFVLDGVSDTDLINTVKEWKNECSKFGLDILVFCSNNADSIASANIYSKKLNDSEMHNIFGTLTYDEVEYSSAEVAVWVAARALGQSLKESMCNEETIFTNIKQRLSREQLESAITSGTMTFTITQGKVVVLDDVNTYKTYKDAAEKILGNLRAQRFINIVNKNTSLKGERDFVGKIENNDTGHAIILSGIKQFFDVWVSERIIKDDYEVVTDEDLQKTAEPDQYFWKWNANYVEVAKRIFGTGNLQYASN